MPTPDRAPELSSLTPVLPLETIESALPFWIERLGFEVTTEVPHGDVLGFVILERGALRLMLQSVQSIREDDARVHAALVPGTPILFFQVESISAIQEALEGWDSVLIPYRETWYGAKEVFVLAPGGAVVGFAEFEG